MSASSLQAGAAAAWALSSLGAAALEALAAAFTDAHRLHALEAIGQHGQQDDPLAGMLVEAWAGQEALSRPYAWHVIALSRDARPAPADLLARAARLRTTLADGRAAWRSGLVQSAQALGSDGGFSRYRLTLVPWLQLLSHRSASRIWQDAPVQRIVEDLFAPYAAHAAWRWSDDAAAELAASPQAGLRGLRVQYRESDLAFLHRLLAAEGLGYCFEEDASAPAGHRLLILADSTRLPEDASSAAGGGIRFHRSSPQEPADTVQAFSGWRILPAASTTVLGWDGLAQRAAVARLPAAVGHAGDAAPVLERYELSGTEPGLSSELGGDPARQAAHLARRAAQQAQALDARHKTWLGRGCVRSLRAGTQFVLRGSPLDALAGIAAQDADRTRFTALGVLHAGINNLPKELGGHLAAALGAAFDGWDAEAQPGARGDDGEGGVPRLRPGADLLAQARATGYANAFVAVRAAVAWRPPAPPPRRAGGLQTAIVVGPAGEPSTRHGDVHTDLLGRVRVRFHWQHGPRADARADNRLSCWMRCAQRWAGPAAAAGMGAQFVPRIGQEVLVDFIGGDVEQPIVIGALYNGQDEHGNLPAWRGAAEQAPPGALSGWRSNELGRPGGSRYNQLLFDDRDGRLALQAGSTQHATWLRLGHLLQGAGHPPGSLRGLGLELRTDACGSLRAGRGLLLSTWAQGDHEPALDDAAGLALARQQQQLATAFSGAARAHQSLQPASDACDSGQLPQACDPIAALSAQAGIGLTATQDLQLAAGGPLHLAGGRDAHQAAGGALRVHSGRAIGILAGASGLTAQAAGSGLTAIAAGGDVRLQAQQGPLHLAARGDLQIRSAGAPVELAAARRVVLKTSAGACLTLEGGRLSLACPGRLTVHAATKSMDAPPPRPAAQAVAAAGEQP